MLLTVTAGGVSDNGIVALCAALSVAIAGALAVYTILNNRADKEERLKEKTAEERATDTGELAEVKSILERFMLAMLGRAADKKLGLPKIDGFVDEVRTHNTEVDSQFTQIWEELKTENGGGTIKGKLQSVSTDVGALRTGFDGLKETVDQLAEGMANG